MCSPINGGDAPRPPHDPSPPLPHLWHLIHLLSHSVGQLLENSRLSTEPTPENAAAYELNRVSIRAWLAHLLRVVRTPAHAPKQLVDLDDVQTVFDEIACVKGQTVGDEQSLFVAKRKLMDLLKRGVKS